MVYWAVLSWSDVLSIVGYCIVVLNVSDHGYRTVGNVDHRVAPPHVHQVYVHNNGTLSLAFRGIMCSIALEGPVCRFVSQLHLRFAFLY